MVEANRPPRKWSKVLLAVALGTALLAYDASRVPARQQSAKVLRLTIDVYQATFSGRMGIQCRFEPSCSHYAEEALLRFGVLRGSWLAVSRIGRCGPWTAQGTSDPVPGGPEDVSRDQDGSAFPLEPQGKEGRSKE